MKRLLSLTPIFAILGLITIIIVTNYVPGTILTGGDNLHPEFNFLLNIKRSFFGVWQEYQGLGLLAAMGHASDFFRLLFLYFLSLFMPTESIRYFWTFLTLLIGGIGSYYLVLKVLQEKAEGSHEVKQKAVALSGAFFYILNLVTLQQYYTAFEVFTSHFAFLPWLLLTALNYFKHPSTKNLALSGIVLLLAAGGAYVPTLFVVYLLAVGILMLSSIHGKKIKGHLRSIFKFLGMVFVINSFWILPFAYFTITNSSVIINAKQNQMASDAIFLLNKEFGDLSNTMLLKGFWFNNIEPNSEGKFVYMLEPWKNHLNNPLTKGLGIAFFLVTLLGIINTVKKRKRMGIAFAGLFVFSFTMITTSTPPFSWLVTLLRDYLPLFSEVFRFPFTKFSLLVALCYAIFFALGIETIIDRVRKNSKKVAITTLAISMAALIYFNLPTFKGDFFYNRETISIPSEYREAFSYLETQDKTKRIANFPQFSFWEWNFFNWGYSGSGFIWYGIPQPIMDRAFDSWSAKNENYYWEMTNALYSKNPKLFEEVLNKYQISLLWLDKSRLNSTSSKNLSIEVFEEVVDQIPSIKKSKTFGKITIYEVDLKTKPNEFVFTTGKLNAVNSAPWITLDKAYGENQNYVSRTENNDIVYPFRSALFTHKSEKQVNFGIEDKYDHVEFVQTLQEIKRPVRINIPSPVYSNTTLPVKIIAEAKDSNILISFKLSSPVIYLEENSKRKKLWENDFKQELFVISPEQKFPLTIDVNGASRIELTELKENGDQEIGATHLYLEEDNVITISDENQESLEQQIVPGDFLKSFYLENQSSFLLKSVAKNTKIIVDVPKVTDGFYGETIDPLSIKDTFYNCDLFRKGPNSAEEIEDNEQKYLRLSAKNSNACVADHFPEFVHDQSYLIIVNNRNIKGRGFHFWMLNETLDFPPIDTYLPTNKKLNKTYFVIPPMEEFGNTYSMHFESSSIGQEEVINDLGKVEMVSIPYHFITGIYLGENEVFTNTYGPKLDVSHPNESLYKVALKEDWNDPYTLVLSQGYDEGWQAYEVKNSQSSIINNLSMALPFIFGKRINTHVMVNNWENGWTLDGSDSKIVIVFLPQYLEYFGFALGIGFFGFIIIAQLRNRRKTVSPFS